MLELHLSEYKPARKLGRLGCKNNSLKPHFPILYATGQEHGRRGLAACEPRHPETKARLELPRRATVH
jgi:hypothetical protein